MRCALGLHSWKWFHLPFIEKGTPKRMCLRCGKMEYHG